MKLEIFDQKEIFVLILFMLLDLLYIIGISTIYFPPALDHTTEKKIKSMDSRLRLSGFMLWLYHLLTAWP